MRHAKAVGLAGLACAMLTLGVTAPATAAEATRPRTGDVQKALSELARSPEVLGAIGAVYVDGKRVDKGSGGTRLLDGKGGRIPAGARFRIGSQTKSMTSAAIMKLVTEGEFDLDSKLSEVLPVVVEKDLVERADEITVEQMIHHTSGIPNWYTPELIDPFDFETRYTPMELITKSRTLPREQEPGEKFSYSNTNYYLLGLIIEKFTGQSLAAEFEERFFEPLNMDDTYLPTRWPGSIKGPHGHGYFPGKNGELVDFDNQNMSYGYAAGGVISTADDLSAFHRAFAMDKILTKEEKEALNAGRPSSEPDRAPNLDVCDDEGTYGHAKGSSYGFNALTFSTRDGSVQLIMSLTLATEHSDPAIDPLSKKAAEAVLCPEK
ncbi:serine hydrolase domain-containing protein [Nonomuraea deserti]|uniref:serine hydrolase domain-containing protein n=1 Tax=Nonomuraea deserti TaxID=1848322 RepID=UPI0014050F40|nr:serine hydrolase domain-containing protein [Nonomuraea deserti]